MSGKFFIHLEVANKTFLRKMLQKGDGKIVFKTICKVAKESISVKKAENHVFQVTYHTKHSS